MNEIILGVSERQITTKSSLHKVRESGLIPGIVYGEKEKNIAISVKEKDFYHIIHTELGENALIKLKTNDSSKTVLIKEIQHDMITDKPIHIDFYIVSLKKKIEVDVPVHIIGEARGIKESGGILEHLLREIHVRCLPTNIPRTIDVDVSNLNIGNNITVKDLPKIPEVEILSDLNSIVVNVVAPTKVEEIVAAVPEEVSAGPEIISKGKKEEEGVAEEKEQKEVKKEVKEEKEGKKKGPPEKK